MSILKQLVRDHSGENNVDEVYEQLVLDKLECKLNYLLHRRAFKVCPDELNKIAHQVFEIQTFLSRQPTKFKALELVLMRIE
jgi:hypothetical protein